MSYNGWRNRETWCVTLWFDLNTVEDVDNAKAILEEEEEKLPDFMRDFVNIDAIDWEKLYDTVKENES